MEDYEILSKIGSGTFGTVYLCKTVVKVPQGPHKSVRSVDEESFVAIKKMKRRYSSWQECMELREVKALKQLNHKHIILLKEVIREDNHLYLVFEYMNKSLYQLIKDQVNPFPEKTIRLIVAQIASGISYIHRHGFFHRDIKPENILCKNGSGCIKIADFGLTREIDSEPPYTEYVSTRWYRAPEILLHSSVYNWTVDIWSLGCIVSELYTLNPLFPGRSEIDQLHKICQVIGSPNEVMLSQSDKMSKLMKFNFPNIVPLNLADLLKGCSESGFNFVKSTLKWAPQDRPTAKQLLNHSFLGS